MMPNKHGRSSRLSWLGQLLSWPTLDHLCAMAVIAFVVLSSGLFYAAFANHEYVLDWTVVTTLRSLKPGVVPSGLDLAKLEAGAQAFEAARSKLLSADAISFLIALMTLIVFTIAVKVFDGAEKKIKRAEKRIDQAHQISRRLSSFMGATSASIWASTLASMVDRNMDRLTSELVVSKTPDREDAIVGVMTDLLKSLKDTLHNPEFVKIGVPKPTFNSLCESVAQIDSRFKNINITLEKDVVDTKTNIDSLVRDWLASSNAPEPRNLEEGTRRLHEITYIAEELRAEGRTDESTLASIMKPRLLQHEFAGFPMLLSVVGKLHGLDACLECAQTHQALLRQLRQTIDECRKALSEDLYRHWEEFNEDLEDA